MATKRFVEIDANTGRYLGDWVGEDNNPQPMAGRLLIQMDPDAPAPAAGSTWNGASFVAQQNLPDPLRLVTRVAFARLFTVSERIAVRTAAANNAALNDFYELLQLADAVNLDHPDVAAGLTAMVSGGILTPDRKTAILAGTPPA